MKADGRGQTIWDTFAHSFGTYILYVFVLFSFLEDTKDACIALPVDAVVGLNHMRNLKRRKSGPQSDRKGCYLKVN